MPTTSDLVLAPMVRKLEHWHPFTEEERRAVLTLPHTTRDLAPNQFVVWDGDRPQHSCLLISGFAIRHKIAGNGGRQIMSIHMKGDLIDLQNSLLGVADHNVQMIAAGTVAMIPVQAIREIAFSYPAVGMAMWYESLVEASIFREWILNVGRRDAFTAIAHLLCEFALRMEVAELGSPGNYELPFTQEQMSDAVSLTAVHVNRTLMRLEEEGHIRRTKRKIQIDDWQNLAKVADFEPRYLHLNRSDIPPGIPATLAERGRPRA
ncbi:MAG: Crp/Fnr family transcriptional regulator [Terriglobales bacterium]